MAPFCTGNVRGMGMPCCSSQNPRFSPSASTARPTTSRRRRWALVFRMSFHSDFTARHRSCSAPFFIPVSLISVVGVMLCIPMDSIFSALLCSCSESQFSCELHFSPLLLCYASRFIAISLFRCPSCYASHFISLHMRSNTTTTS